MTISSCGFKPYEPSKVGIVRRGLFPLLLFMVGLAGSTVSAQNRLSADVTIRQLYKKKVVRVEKQLFYNYNGNLVVHYLYPQEYYVLTNSLGETSVYQPKVNEVMMINDRTTSSYSEFFTIFLTPDYADLNLVKSGFVVKEVRKEEDNVI